MKTKLPHLLTFAALLAFPPLTQAQTSTSAVPGTISYQGRVLTANGQLVGAGTPVNRTVIFRIWDSPSNTLDANLLYSEAQTVTIAEGEFSVLVGTGAANPTQTFGYSETAKGPPTVSLANVFNGSARFLGVTVAAGATIGNTDNEITPRQQIVSSAFSFRSRFAENLGTSTSTALTTVDSGHVGIGITNPPARLTVTASGTGTSSPQMVITADDVTERLRIGLDSTGNGTGYIQSFKEGTGAQNLLLNPSGGNVGIGLSTAPTAPLDVNGGIKAAGASGFTFNTGDLDGGLFSPADGMVTLRTNNTERLRVDGSGNVGIGTTTPGERLTIVGSGSTNTSTALSVWNSAITPLLHVRNDGNVGIGTSAPAARLDVAGKASAFAIQARGSVTSRDQGGYLEWNLNGQGETNINNQKGLGSGGFTFNEVDANNSYTERMRISGSGNVGIGTTNPVFRLQVTGGNAVVSGATATDSFGFVGVTNTGVERFSLGFAGTAGSWSTDAAIGDAVVRGSNGKLLLQSGSGASAICITTSNNVGIGITNPTQGRLVVTGAGSTNNFGSTWIYGSGGAAANGPVNETNSIYASASIAGSHFRAFSDRRIKQIVGRSDSSQDLATVLGIEITDYRYIDKLAYGNKTHKKVIAQQLEQVFPEAVKQTTDVVPDIYKRASVKDGWITLTTELKKGERVRLISPKEDGVYEVLEVKKDGFRTAFKPQRAEVFVFGREVNDFRSVDYEAISMLNVSATQQIKKEKDAEVKALKDENADLKARVEALEAQTERLAELEAKDKARDAKLAAIEKLLLAADKGGVQPVLLKKSADGAE